jgi:hypothetical protein
MLTNRNPSVVLRCRSILEVEGNVCRRTREGTMAVARNALIAKDSELALRNPSIKTIKRVKVFSGSELVLVANR